MPDLPHQHVVFVHWCLRDAYRVDGNHRHPFLEESEQVLAELVALIAKLGPPSQHDLSIIQNKFPNDGPPPLAHLERGVKVSWRQVVKNIGQNLVGYCCNG